MDSKNILISVIIPAYNEELAIEQTLSALLNQNFPKNSYEIIVVDNNSKDKTLDISKKFNVKTLSLLNGNVGAVRNFGARNAEGNVLAFIDADCIAEDNWLATGYRLIESSADTVFGGGCKLSNTANWIEKLWLLQNDNKTSIPKDLIGASIFIPKKIFELCDGFNEEVTSSEDSLLSQKIKMNGFKVCMNPSLSVVHLGNATSLFEFMKRQIWHSENYIQRLKDSIVDPVFYIVLLFIASLTTLFLSLINIHDSTPVFYIALAITLAIPSILTVKRIIRSKFRTRNPTYLAGLYFLDFLYVFSRSVGLIKSFAKKIIKR